MTGFTNFEPTMGGKWLELLREIAPAVQRVGMLFSPDTAASGATGGVYLNSIKAAVEALGLSFVIIPVRHEEEIDTSVASFARAGGAGMLVMPNLFTGVHRQRIVAAAAREELPTVYPYRYFVTAGGLVAYGNHMADMFRRAASYVDRILKGEKPADMPIQAPTNFELVINMKTAKALGLTIPPSLFARADEVIE
jgi:putative ABC transport system substrate-binding protein